MNWVGATSAMALLVLVAACEQAPPPQTGGAQRSLAGGASSPVTEPSPGVAVLDQRGESGPPPLPPPRPVVKGGPGDAATGELTAADPAPDSEQTAREKLPFGELVGLNADELLRHMGSPAEVRIQTPATIWEYRFSGCSLALFLFRDVNNQLLKALTFETAGFEVDTTVGRDERCPDPVAEKVADG